MQRNLFFIGILCVLTLSLTCLTKFTNATHHYAVHPESTYHTSWEIIGRGFHTQLIISIPVWANKVNISITLDKTFFFDMEELKHRFIIMGEKVPDKASANKKKQSIDLTKLYALLESKSTVEFDIEAPAFKLPYQNATVVLNLERSATAEDLSITPLTEAKLILPLHVRYPDVIQGPDVEVEPFSLNVLLHGRKGAFQNCCLHDLHVSWSSNKFSAGKSSLKTVLCLQIPSLMLDDLPMAYYSLIGLLWVGAFLIVACMYSPKLSWEE